MHSTEIPVNQDAIKTIALVGAPNSGKSTLYNWLTGARASVVNYPGSTVDYNLGKLRPELAHSLKFQILDTPGTYSLHPKSADEEVTLRALYESPKWGAVSGIIVVIDATQLARHLVLAQQVKETGFPMVLAVTMGDLLQSRSIHPNLAVLKTQFNCPVILLDGVLGGGLKELVQAVESIPAGHPKKPELWNQETQKKKMLEAEELAVQVIPAKEDLAKVSSLTEKIDSYLLHPVLGVVFFVAIMTALFAGLFWFVAPVMDIVDQLFGGMAEKVSSIQEGALWSQFLGNGIIASFGAVLVFVPQIFLLFVMIGFLEASGYLARASTIIDKPLSKLGLSGRSFVPLLSGFACAVPAIMAARNIPSVKERRLTQLILPLMTCSARLPVYALMIGVLGFDQSALAKGLWLAGLYFGSVLLGVIVTRIISKYIPEKQRSFFMMELPIYRLPKPKHLVKEAGRRTLSYVTKAGGAIFIFAVLVWTSTYFPRADISDPTERINHSYAAQAGHVVQPLLEPMGADWRVGIGLISAFAAREVFVSTLAVVFQAPEGEDDGNQGLISKLSTATLNGEPLFTFASVMALIVFFMIALQCSSTVGVQIKEFNSVKWGLIILAVYNLVAYVAAVGTYQLFRLF